jgi:hypothetical protein
VAPAAVRRELKRGERHSFETVLITDQRLAGAVAVREAGGLGVQPEEEVVADLG